MARRLPPFAAMRAFEATARKGSLQDASDELLISASAVSHQIKSLEIFLGVKLFVRKAKGLELTTEGAAYFEQLAEALDRMDAATRRTEAARDTGAIKIRVFQSFAQLWLIPRLAGFMSSNPDIPVQFTSRGEDEALGGSDVDLAVVYADAPPAEFICDRLIEEEIFPVCAPDYLAGAEPLETAQDVFAHCLIGCDLVADEWQGWMSGAGVAPGNKRPQLMFDTRSQVLQAAVEGLGLAMNRSPFGEGLLRSGKLVAPFGHKQVTGFAYYLVAPERSDTRPAVKRLRAWLLSQIA
ncbi:LysR family transcriptional regulator [Aquicoccus sp. SCR17]|nr:LysR family transcriptional regulator [Carideicomes alvinocaridis]